MADYRERPPVDEEPAPLVFARRLSELAGFAAIAVVGVVALWFAAVAVGCAG